jgi:putative membrane protein
MHKMVTIGALVLGMAAGGAALAQRDTPTTDTTNMPPTTGAKRDLSMKDRQFLMKAASGGLAEVKSAQLAVEKAQSDDVKVKQAAQKILDDHQKTNDQLKQIAAAHDIAMPTEVSSEDKQSMQKLQRASGSEFDRMYMREMMKDHEKAIAEFQRAARELQDPQLREFATTQLPILRQHHQLIMGAGGSKGMKEMQKGNERTY